MRGAGLTESTPARFCVFSDAVSSEISLLCETSALLLFVSYFASQSKRIKFENYLFDVFCVN